MFYLTKLTGLTSAMLVDEGSTPFEELVDFPSGSAGLYIKDKQGTFVKVSIPADCLAFQIGEAAQVASRGLLVATPHLVRGISSTSVARNTFAVFMQPNVDEMLTEDMNYYEFSEQVFARHY